MLATLSEPGWGLTVRAARNQLSDGAHLAVIRKRVVSVSNCLNYPPSEGRLRDLLDWIKEFDRKDSSIRDERTRAVLLALLEHTPEWEAATTPPALASRARDLRQAIEAALRKGAQAL